MALVLVLVGCAGTDPFVRAVAEDPVADPRHPAAMGAVQIPTDDGDPMNGIVYSSAGVGPHPAVVLLHGFPGNEQSLDLAQAMRRVGWTVLAFHYRGSWGSPGAFSFTHAVEDGHAAIAFLRAKARTLRIDPARIAVVGHSMGGFIAAELAAADPTVIGAALIAPWDISADAAVWEQASSAELAAAAEEIRPDTIPLNGTSAEALIRDAIAHRAQWDLAANAAELGSRPVLVVSTNDGGQPAAHAFADAARTTARVTEVHFATDHSLSDHRIALSAAVARWLSSIPTTR